ncbi:MAG: hypothetical protein AB8F95_20390 [Bacteroidia bacterium]
MEILSLIAEGLKYALPAGLVLLAVWLQQKNNQKILQTQQLALVKADLLRQQMPARFNAYERTILYLDRIKAENLIQRAPVAVMNAGELHKELVSQVRTEYEHNMAQQLYISDEGWQQLLQAREETLTLMNTVRSELETEDSGLELARRLLERSAQVPPPSIQSAIKLIKREASSFMQV